VLMGRAGQWLLRGIPHVLRVRVMRLSICASSGLGKKLLGADGRADQSRTVHDMARRDDMDKSGRMRYLYEVDVKDPALYDLVINTEKLSIDASVELIAGTLQRPELADHAGRASSSSPIGRWPRASRSPWPPTPQTRKYRITVEAKTGVVTLEGTAAMDEAVDVARGVVGVRDVKTQQVDIPPIPPFVA